MKTLITYSTTHGCTQKIALKLKDFLGGEVQLISLLEEARPDIQTFDRIIIGGSIHAGRIQKSVRQFCNSNINELKDKELGLFICCMEEGDKAQIQFNDAFPEILRRKAKATACFGGEFDFEKMTKFQKLIIKKVAKIESSTSKVDHEAIHQFSTKMEKIFNPFLFLA